MKEIKYLLTLLLIATIFFTCKKSHKPIASEEIIYEPKTSVAAAIEQTASITIDLNDIVLPNGSRLMDFELQNDLAWLNANKNLLPAKYVALLNADVRVEDVTGSKILGPQGAKNVILCRAQIEGNYLTNRSNFTELVRNKQDPQQVGLAYIYGGRDFKSLKRSSGKCSEMLYGLDCSGMLMDMMAQSGVIFDQLKENSASLSTKSTWVNALKKAGSGYDKINVQTYSSTEMPLNKIVSGDVIYFYGWNDEHTVYGVKHIGIALTDPSNRLVLYQSNGKSNSNCDKNYDSNHGPRRIAVLAPMSGWGFEDYGVLRLTASISGEWTAYIRCKDAVTDAITLKINFPVIQNGSFTATGTGTDYNGQPVNVIVNGTYDAQKNYLTGVINFTFPQDPTEKRSDNFNIDLSYDDTGYWDLTKALNNNGCNVKLRLVNLQNQKVNGSSTNQQTDATKCNCSLSGTKMQ